MIIVDYSAIAIAAVFSQDKPEKITEGLIRHMILNSIRKYNLQFRSKYGELIIATDSNSWRKSVFPHYKANRKKGRDDSGMDWQLFFEYINKVKDEIHEFMPYRVISTYGAEADDIIAVLTMSTQDFGKDEPVVIISSDKDFIQLHKFKNVKQFSPMKKKFIVVDDPKRQLFELICRGDQGDGIPNILSDDDTFVTDKRQTPLRETKIESLYNSQTIPEDIKKNFERNQMLIDFRMIPVDVVNSIETIYNSTGKKSNSKVLNYLIEKRCSTLVTSVEEFFVK